MIDSSLDIINSQTLLFYTWMDVRIADTSYVGDHLSASMLALFFSFLKCFIQLNTGIQYFGRHDKKFGVFFKTALNRARPGLHEFT